MSIQSRLLVFLAALTVISACSGGNKNLAVAGPTTVTAPIGPVGGTVVSGDGLLMLNIPAGALATMEVIQVTRLTNAEADPLLATKDPEIVYRLEPDGLQFLLPIVATLEMEAPLNNTPGQVSTNFMFSLVASGGSLEALGDQELCVDVSANTTTIIGELSHFSEIAGFVRRGADFLTFSVDHPTVLIDNQLGTVTGSLDKSASSGTVSGPIVWEVNAQPGMTSSIETEEVYDSLGLLVGVEQHLMKTSTIACAVPGLNVFSLRYEASFDGIFEVTSFPANIFFTNLAINCLSSPGPPELPYTTPQLFNLPQLSSAEAVRRVEPFFPFADDFTAIVAGAGGASIIDLVDGSTSTFFDSAPSESFFDVMVFPSNSPGEDAGLVLSGTDLIVERVDPAGNLGVFSQVNGGQHLDSNYDGNDPANGGHVAGPGVIRKIVYQPLSQGYEFQDTGIPVSQIPTGLQSVQANAAGDKLLAVGAFELFFIDGTGPGAIGTSAGSLGSNPRRLRWDPASGLGAISDFIDDTVTLFLWDGQTAPSITQTVTVGDGPVGIDVSGNRVATAGFNDNSYTIIEVDANGMATATSTNPVPFGPGGLNPGHIIFLNDPYSSVVLSFNGDGTVGVIPFAY